MDGQRHPRLSFLSAATCLGLLMRSAVLTCADPQHSYVPSEDIELDYTSMSESSPSDDRETDLDIPGEVLRAQSHKQLTHSFPVSPGQKFVRLHPRRSPVTCCEWKFFSSRR